MSIRTINSPPRLTTRGRTPTLLNGDHLSVPEFEHRYSAMLGDAKAELIEGIAIMSPPISASHGQANSLLGMLLGQYAAATPGVSCAINPSLRLDGGNEYQPDVVLWIDRGPLANAKVGSDGLLEGRPELVAEISLSSQTYDLHEKKEVYRRNSIPEYIVWELNEDSPKFHWFHLENGEYIFAGKPPRTKLMTLCSVVFPGLWLDAFSICAGRGIFDKAILRTLDKGLKSAEHKTFVRKLALY
jgi:Uma2 family endonuclease